MAKSGGRVENSDAAIRPLFETKAQQPKRNLTAKVVNKPANSKASKAKQPKQPKQSKQKPETGARRQAAKRTVARALFLFGEVIALMFAATVAIIFVLGGNADWITSRDLLERLILLGAVLIALILSAAIALVGWRYVSRSVAQWTRAWVPMIGATAIALYAGFSATTAEFSDAVRKLQTLIGGTVVAERAAVGHQVFAAYRRANLDDLVIILERGRVYEPTVLEAANEFGIDPGVLMGIAATESSFWPRPSRDGGQGLFQITKPPKRAVESAKEALGIKNLDQHNQRHNAYVGAATFKLYLGQMGGDLFLGLLAYNIGPYNGGLRSIMGQYGAKDFVTIQPYLKNLPRDYPVRVLSAALAYRVWKAKGELPPYQEGDNALEIQRLGVPGLDQQTLPQLIAWEQDV